MEIVPIFGELLFAIKFSGETKDEYAKLFELWQDPEYLEDFFEGNQADLKSGFWGDVGVVEATLDTYDYATELEERLLELCEQSKEKQLDGLEALFKPLHDSQTKIIPLNQSKAKRKWLRIYALRVESNVYIITGGAIKLTRTMQEREHTNQELIKLEDVRKYLLDNDIIGKDDVIEFIES